MIRSRRAVTRLLVVAVPVAALAVVIPAAAAADRGHLRVSIANAGSVERPPVGKILDDQKPHVMVVSEAYRARKHLAAVAENKGYRLRQYTRKQGAEAPDIALLIRKGVTIEDRVLLKMKEPWWWKSGKREPRRYPAVVVRVDDRKWHVIGVHFPPGGPSGGKVVVDGKNRPAWIESRKAVQAYAARHPNAPVVAAGDVNATAKECRNHFPGFVVAQGGKVDHALVKKDRGARVDRVIRHPNPGPNMHGWVSFRLSVA